MGFKIATQNHFGRPPANVHHQASLSRLRQQMRHPLVDHPRLFTPGNHVDWKAEQLVSPGEKHIAVPGLTHGLCGNCAYLAFLKAGQTFTKTSQAVPAALHGLLGEVAVRIKSVALTNCFF